MKPDPNWIWMEGFTSKWVDLMCPQMSIGYITVDHRLIYFGITDKDSIGCLIGNLFLVVSNKAGAWLKKVYQRVIQIDDPIFTRTI